jgi:hypothetical protein
MKKESAAKCGDDLREEYDLSKLKGGVRGKYYRRATAGSKQEGGAGPESPLKVDGLRAIANSPNHLLISYEEAIPEVLLQPFSEMVSAPGLSVVVESRPVSGAQAGIHWLLPTAVVIYVSKSYFDGYLREAGKEHYHLLKAAIGSLWSSFFGENRAVRALLIGSRGKVPANQKYSVTISVMAEADSGLRFKLLFEDECSSEELNLGVAGFFGFLEKYYEDSLDKETRARLASARVIGKTILLAYDKESDFFVFLDPVPTKTGR